MFELSRRYIRTGFIFFIVGLILGLYIVINKYILGRWPSPKLITAHVHVLLFGFNITYYGCSYLDVSTSTIGKALQSKAH